MTAREWFRLKAAGERIRTIEEVVESLMGLTSRLEVPLEPARDITVLETKHHPPKPRLSTIEGQGRLLHDVANIELQAMELAVRTLCEYPEAPPGFREELAQLAVDEARHLKLCFDGLNEMGVLWGQWPIHTALWDQTPANSSLIERIFTVHRHMEGSGLDAGSAILTRLSGVGKTISKSIISVILKEEIDHVSFGTRWYRTLCIENGKNPDEVFSDLLKGALLRSPRSEKPDLHLREKAGFSKAELAILSSGL